jgi:16S rRNA (adenine1518-N6/adenine1519-N6)-dimethyltransferase
MVKAKKHLGQHFLTDKNIAQKIVDALSAEQQNILEIGPGMGMLTQLILANPDKNLIALDVDEESVAYLQQHYPENKDQFLLQDFLKADLTQIYPPPFAVIGNFPYNISSQILFKVLENRHHIPELVGMFQKEVAERIASKPGNKVYGILSVLSQAFYDTEYLFTVHEHVFSPAPKVKSAVIRMNRKARASLGCDETLFFKVVKAGFNQRRKTLRNSLKRIHPELTSDIPFLDKRPEQLSIEDFILLTSAIEKIPKQA